MTFEHLRLDAEKARQHVIKARQIVEAQRHLVERMRTEGGMLSDRGQRREVARSGQKNPPPGKAERISARSNKMIVKADPYSVDVTRRIHMHVCCGYGVDKITT